MPFALGTGNGCHCAVCFWREARRNRSAVHLDLRGGGGINKEINGNLPEEVEDASFFCTFFFLEVSSEQMTLTVAGGKLWWADEESAQLGTVTKRDGRNPLVLRNKTSGVVHMKVYDREGQKGVPARAHQPTLAHSQKKKKKRCCK